MRAATVDSTSGSGARWTNTEGRPLTGQVLLVAATIGGLGWIGWWWANTGLGRGVGDWLTAGGRITGLLAGYLLAVNVLLMARIPALERDLGADRLARWHATAGRYTVSLIVAHGVLIASGYAVTTRTDLVAQAVSLVLDYPDVLMATAGGLLLVAVAFVSLRAARRRLRYETWYYLHLYTYLAVALVFAHVFATGAEFMTHPAARAVWILLYLAAAGSVIYYRIATPVIQAVRHRFTVNAVVPENAEVVSIVLEGRNVHRLDVKPGQFVRLRFLARGWWWASHPFSLSAPRHGNLLRVTVKALGDHTAEVRAIRPGTRVLLEGPYGAFTADRRTRRRVLLLAGGIGITPLRSLFHTLPASAGEVTLIYRASHDDDLVLRRELDHLARIRDQTVHFMPGPAGGPTDVLVGERLRRLVPDLPDHDAYVCGPRGFTAAATAVLRRAGVPARQIHTETFAF
ncbi:MAG TPA: ferredoxin reductase family protein [Jiangellaceae bacterium]